MEILEKDIIKDINRNKKIIKYHQLYSIKSLIIKLLLKSGILLDYAYPYILSILIMLNVGFYKNHKPFDYDPAKKITTENIYDSNNNTEINFDNNIIYDNDYLIYRTPWELVDGKYISKETTFVLNQNEQNKSILPSLLKMDYDEIKSLFEIKSIKTIYKNNSNSDDALVTVIVHDETLSPKTVREIDAYSTLYVILVLGGFMNNNLSKEQLEIKERLERIINIFTYRYIKAGTKSKKNLIASDLISLSRINREYFSDFKLSLSWDSDDSLYTESLLSCYKYIENIIINQDKYFKIFNSAVEQILSTKPNIYRYYGKDYLKHPKKELGIVFISFLESFDTKLYNQYMSMLDRENIFYASLKGYNGQNYPFSILNENMIFIDSSFEENVEFYKVLSHELGHSYEANLYLNSGRIREYDKTFNSPFYEVPSSFIEYAYINYLIENNIYKNEANMLLHDYIIELLINSIYANIICRISDIESKFDEELKIDVKEFTTYLETIGRNYNVHLAPENNKISLRDPFIYGFGQLFSIYMYENYKKDSEYFKREFNKSLLDYSLTEDMSSFKRVGVSYEELIKGNTLKKALTKNS